MKGLNLLSNAMRILILASLVIGISACGGGGSDSDTDTGDTDTGDTDTVILTGIFIDSTVIGLDYFSDSNTEGKKTNSSGELEYLEGEIVTFKIGDITLGSAPGAEIITTFDIGDSLTKDGTTGEYNDLNIATLLQSLDNNQNPADGTIDLTGVVINLDSGVNIEDGITQEELDKITGGGVTLVSTEEVALHATLSLSGAIVEEDGVLKLASTLSQEDVDAGNYRVYTRVGHEFIATDPTTANPVFYIESDITALSNVSLYKGRVRNRIDIFKDNITYYMGLGIMYQNGAYSLNYFIEREDSATGAIEELPNNFVGDFSGVTIEENKTYKFKLELDLAETEEKVSAYIDGVKAIEWTLPDSESDEGETTVKVYVENRADSVIDEATNTGIAGTSLVGTFDNLNIHLDGETLLSDDFNDNTFSNEDINYSTKFVISTVPTIVLPLDASTVVGNTYYQVIEGIVANEGLDSVFTTTFDESGSVTILEDGITSTLDYTIEGDRINFATGRITYTTLKAVNEDYLLFEDTDSNETRISRLYFTREKADAYIDSIRIYTVALLTQNPWYIVAQDGDCWGKFEYSDNEQGVIHSFADNGALDLVAYTHTIDLNGDLNVDMSIDSNDYSDFRAELVSISPLSFDSDYYFSDGGDDAAISFKNYSDAIAYAAARGNSNCSSSLPE